MELTWLFNYSPSLLLLLLDDVMKQSVADIVILNAIILFTDALFMNTLLVVQ